VYALGRFAVEVNSAPLRFAGRAPRRPLALLKTLIALGGESVPTESLCDALWPDAEGHDAAKSLSVNLSRLRNLIGAQALTVQDARVSLEPRHCWVDALACRTLLEQVRLHLAAGRTDLAAVHMRQVLELYRGQLLEGEYDPLPLLSGRERLHSQFLRQLEALAQAYSQAGNPDAAVALYRRGLDRDELADTLVQGLLRVCLASGRHAEGLAAYQRYEAAQRAMQSTVPSLPLRSLYQRLQSCAQEGAEAPNPLSPNVSDELSLAVLAFENLSGDPGQAYLSDGLTDNITTALARIPRVLVVARNPSNTYNARSLDARQLGRELGVPNVLQGSVLRSGQRLHITVQLIDTRTAGLTWAAAYDREMLDVLMTMDEITQKIVTELGVSVLYGEGMRYFAGSTSSAEGLDKLLLAAHLLHKFEPQTNSTAKVLAAEALELDPHFARAMALLGQTCLNEMRYGWGRDPDAAFREAESWAQRSLEADARCVPGLNLMCRILCHQHRYDEAIEVSRRAAEIEPGSGKALADYAATLLFAGEPQQALVIVKRALRLSPAPSMIPVQVAAETCFILGRHEEAQAYYELLLERNAAPSEQASNARRKLIAIHMAAGRETEARALATQQLALRPDFTLTRHREVHQRWPHRDYSWFEPYLDLLRRAGLPD
jgi:TolB-like protein/cytochrome c-type biogenesis protein CcmH/NrfG